jgi:preprotein translocase subunit SecE
MVINMENQGSKFDNLLWGLAVVLLVSGIGGQYYFASLSLLLRVAALLITTAVSLVLISRTQLGIKALGYWRESLAELRKVVWPTKQETIHSTVAVLVMVFAMGLVLWSIDAVLVRIMAWIVRQGAV